MTTYIWFGQENYPEKAFGFYDHKHAPSMYQFIQGKEISDLDKPLIFNIKGSLKDFSCYDHIENNVHLPLASPRLQTLLNEYCPNDIQYLDTIINYKGGTTTQYKAVNIISSVLAVDHNLSTMSYIVGAPEVISGFKHLAFLKNCMKEHHLARNKEFKPQKLVSEKLFEVFKKHKVIGVKLMTAYEYNNIPIC